MLAKREVKARIRNELRYTESRSGMFEVRVERWNRVVVSSGEQMKIMNRISIG